MKLSDLVIEATRNMTRKKLRSLLTMVGITIGCFTVILTVSVAEGIKDFLVGQVKGFSNPLTMHVSHKKGLSGMRAMNSGFKSFGNLPRKIEKGDEATTIRFMEQDDIDNISKIDHVRAVKPVVILPLNSIRLEGEETKYEINVMPWVEEEPLHVETGEKFSSKGAREIILSPGFAEVFGKKQEDLVGKYVFLEIGQPMKNLTAMFGMGKAPQLEPVKVKIRGFTRKMVFNTLCWLPEDYARFLSTKAFSVQFGLTDILMKPKAAVKALSLEQMPSPMAKVIVDQEESIQPVKRKLEKSGYRVMAQEDALAALEEIFGAVKTALSFFAVIALVVATLGIVNTIFMAASERRREIAVMMALGATRRNVRSLFALEAGAIGFWGGLIAAALANLAGLGINWLASAYWPHIWTGYDLFAFQWYLVPLILAGGAALGYLAGLYPAQRASGQDPIEILRYN